jgi:hypothetical protein
MGVMMTSEGYLQPFVNELVFAVSPHGYLVSGYTSECAIQQLDHTGRPIRRITRVRARSAGSNGAVAIAGTSRLSLTPGRRVGCRAGPGGQTAVARYHR